MQYSNVKIFARDSLPPVRHAEILEIVHDPAIGYPPNYLVGNIFGAEIEAAIKLAVILPDDAPLQRSMFINLGCTVDAVLGPILA